MLVTYWKKAIMAIFILLLTGCASKTIEPIFYPAKPDPPRIQYLTSFASASDVKSGMAQLLSEGELSLVRPFGVAFHNDKLYVVDMEQRGYMVIDPKNNKMEIITGSADNSKSLFNKPATITIAPDGTKYIADSNRVLVYGLNDNYLTSIALPPTGRPGGLAVAGERLLIGDILLHKIHIADRRTAQITAEFKTEKPVMWPSSLSSAEDGSLYVADTGNSVMWHFDKDGKMLNKLGGYGDTYGSFARLKALAIDHDTNIYIADSAFANVQIFNAEGQILMAFGEHSGAAHGLSLPSSMALGYEATTTFQKYAAPGFKLEYVIAVPSTYPPKVNIYGFGKMAGVDYK